MGKILDAHEGKRNTFKRQNPSTDSRRFILQSARSQDKSKPQTQNTTPLNHTHLPYLPPTAIMNNNNNKNSNPAAGVGETVGGAANFLTSTLGNTVGGLGRTVGNVTGAATRGVGDTVTGITGDAGRPLGDGIGNIGTGVQGGLDNISKGVENAGQWKKQ